MQQEIVEIYAVLEIILLELVALNTHFYEERILAIRSQYVNKQSQDFRYDLERNFRTGVL